jgi:hypothetical protein
MSSQQIIFFSSSIFLGSLSLSPLLLFLSISPSLSPSLSFFHSSSFSFGQFHQYFVHAFFVRKSFRQLFSSYVLAKKALSYEKNRRKMLMKLTPSLSTYLSLFLPLFSSLPLSHVFLDNSSDCFLFGIVKS